MTESSQETYAHAMALVKGGQADAAAAILADWLAQHPDDEIAGSMLGSALLQAGKHPEALARFEKAVQQYPNSYAAWGDLAFTCMKLEKTAAAISAFRKATALNASFYQAWCFLGRLLYETDDFAGARAALKAADACDPLAPDFKALRRDMSRGDFPAAERIARSMLQRQAGHPKAAYALAHLAGKAGVHDESQKILRYAIGHFPVDIILRRALVAALEEAGDYAAADEEAAFAADLAPDEWISWFIAGRVRGHYGRYDAGLAAFDRALACPDITPDEIGRIELLRGHLLKTLGRREETVAAYRRSLKLVPYNGAAYWALADLKTYRFDDADLIGMETMIAEGSGAEPAQSCQAAFALGKAHEDAGNWDAAFAAYCTANRLRPDVAFDPDAMDHTMADFMQAFAPAMLDVTAPRGQQAVRPIFIVGLPRSGSTLVEQILASHADVEGTMELFCLPNLIRRIEAECKRRGKLYPQGLKAFSPAELAAFGQSYLDESAIYRTGKPFFIDKLPPNFQHVGLIHKILPDAIIIDARRNPLDTGFSVFRQHFAGGHEFSYDLGHIARYFKAYLAIMDHWDRVLPGKVRLQQYEDTVADTEGAVRALLDHCGLPFDPACLRFFENRRAVRTASSEQVRQPIYRSGVGNWRHFATGLTPLIEGLGPETLVRFGDSVRPD
ncbi:MAG: sulfotransferase family protein [Alphaproteobacteria bacterium]|nr:MAG: sulfotransferase family protein [Alphaproteobacteria bacterium]